MPTAHDHPSETSVTGAALWTLRLIALAALGLSMVLLYKEMAVNLPLPGCGAGSGCDAVFRTAWGRILGFPVGGAAVALYAIVLAALANVSAARAIKERRLAWAVLLFAGGAIFGAAIWFACLQLFVIHAFCKYCSAVHALGIILFIVIITQTIKARVAWSRAAAGGWLLVGILSAASFAGVQTVTQPPTIRQASYGNLVIRINRYPVVGSRHAKDILVLFADYTCPFCRQMHRDVKAAIQHFGKNQLAVAVAPMPLDAKCNRFVKHTLPIHQGGCELAKIALAVWRIKPQAFAEMDDWLFAADHKRSVDAALDKAASLVGSREAVTREMNKPWTTDFLKAQVELNARLGQMAKVDGYPVGDSIPKLILGPHFLDVGQPASQKQFFAELQKQLHLQSPPSP